MARDYVIAAVWSLALPGRPPFPTKPECSVRGSAMRVLASYPPFHVLHSYIVIQLSGSAIRRAADRHYPLQERWCAHANPNTRSTGSGITPKSPFHISQLKIKTRQSHSAAHTEVPSRLPACSGHPSLPCCCSLQTAVTSKPATTPCLKIYFHDSCFYIQDFFS